MWYLGLSGACPANVMSKFPALSLRAIDRVKRALLRGCSYQWRRLSSTARANIMLHLRHRASVFFFFRNRVARGATLPLFRYIAFKWFALLVRGGWGNLRSVSRVAQRQGECLCQIFRLSPAFICCIHIHIQAQSVTVDEFVRTIPQI